MNNRLTVKQQQAIDGLRLCATKTIRPTVQALENILYKPLPVLDHGFVRVIDYMGDDTAIV